MMLDEFVLAMSVVAGNGLEAGHISIASVGLEEDGTPVR